MVTAEITINNKTGLHARPASSLVQRANGFESEITLTLDGKEANAKSILSVMALGAGQGSIINVKATGTDEEAAIKALKQFFANLPEEE